MSNFRVANRYATALMNIALEKKNLVQFSSDVEFVNNTIAQSKELRLFLANPVIKKPVKLAVFKEILKTLKSTELFGFIEFIISKNREEILPDIVKRFLEMRDDHLGILRGEVSCAVELSGKQKESLKKELETYSKKKVELTFKINPKIIGGFLIKAGDTVIDASISNQLKLLRKKFSQQN